MTATLTVYRRRLPHWRVDGAVYLVTWRVLRGGADLAEIEREPIASALRHFDGDRYALLAYVVMNDHVHVLVQPAAGHRLQDTVRSWKSYTAKQLRERGRQGPVWQDEYFDRIMRDADEVQAKLVYIANYPAQRWPGITSYPWLWIRNDLSL